MNWLKESQTPEAPKGFSNSVLTNTIIKDTRKSVERVLNSSPFGDIEKRIIEEANRLNKIESRYTEAIKTKNNWELSKLFQETKKEYQWGLSNEIFYSTYVNEYILECKWVLRGYFEFNGFRTKELDEHLEAGLRKRWLSTQEIAFFLCSSATKTLFSEHDFTNSSVENRKEILDSLLDKMVAETKVMIEKESKNLLPVRVWIRDTFWWAKIMESNLRTTSQILGRTQLLNIFTWKITIRTTDWKEQVLEFKDWISGAPVIITKNWKKYLQWSIYK